MVLRNKLLARSGLNLIHPWVAFIYLAVALILTMCSVNVILILTSLLAVSCIKIYAVGIKRFLRIAPWLGLIVVITTIGNMCVSHNGMHVLFTVSDNRITVEAGIYGAIFGLMFAAAYLWCDVMHSIITSDKLVYMFGSFAPHLGLVISMTLRYIPLLRRRMQIVHSARIGMGRGGSAGILTRLRRWGKEFTTTIAWTLEGSIETSDHMSAMGYGMGRRSSYSNYRFKRRDGVFLIIILILATISFILTLSPNYKMYYYPTVGMMCTFFDIMKLLPAYFVYMLIPLITERIIKWR